MNILYACDCDVDKRTAAASTLYDWTMSHDQLLYVCVCVCVAFSRLYHALINPLNGAEHQRTAQHAGQCYIR